MATQRTAEEWAAMASEQIVSCPGCAAVSDGDYFFDGDRTEVRDFLLWSMQVPDKKVKDVAALLHCSTCHCSVLGGQLKTGH